MLIVISSIHLRSNPRSDLTSEPSRHRIWLQFWSGISKFELFLIFRSSLADVSFQTCFAKMVMMKKIGRMRKGGNPGGFRDGSSFKLSLIWRHNSIPLHTVQLSCTIHTAHRLPSTEHCNLAHCACTLHCLHTVCTAVRTTVHTFSLISISAALLRALAHCTLDILNWFCSKL